MDDLEQRLKAMRLAAPSPDLDRQIDEAFSAAKRIQTQPRLPLWAWWMATVAVAGGTAAMLLIAPNRPRPETQAVVYHFEANGLMRQMLLNPTANPDNPPRFNLRVGSP